ncbi:hypothetical protein D7Y11_34955 [Corallococcus sp. AB018]|nr:hypothetical protein D7Y11_34955 [Corallococcus sp. AB018]
MYSAVNSRRGLRGFLCFSSVADIPCSFHHISGVHGTGPGSGTLLFPTREGTLRPGAFASVGLGVDNAR